MRLPVFSLLLLGVSCVAAPRPGVEARIDSITPSTVRLALEELMRVSPRYSGSAVETARTIAFLRSQLESYGYEVLEEPCGLTIDGVPQSNIVAERTGNREPEVVCEIGAHYDSVPDCPGADDNGTGVIGVLEVARVLADAKVGKTVRFCLFAAEEVGLCGSIAHVAKIERDQETVEGILVLEMIGYSSSEKNSQKAPLRIPLIASLPYTGDFICVIGNFRSGGLGNRFEAAADSYEPELPYYSANRIGGFFADAARSDHSPYWETGRRGVMLTDTANFRNPNYHRGTDTIDTIDFEFMARTTRAAAATMLHWAD